MKSQKYPWEILSLNDLQELRFCDLELSIENSRISPLLDILYEELKAKKLNFRPHVWIAEDWFAMDGVPGIAIPFYVLNKKLSQLCKKMNLEDEGFNKIECLKLLRHEAGHAIDNAFKLRILRKRQQIFGLTSTEYPESYAPTHESVNYVSHLNPWYAQAHPDEDWAETFAIWLTPDSDWKTIYKGTPALKKLEVMDEIMKSIQNKPPLITKDSKPGDITHSRRKIKTFLHEKIDELTLTTELYLAPLSQFIFSSHKKYRSKKRADKFLKNHRAMIVKKVSFWTGHGGFTINSIIEKFILTCSKNNLHLKKSESETKLEIVAMLTTETHNSTIFGPNKIRM